MIKFNNTYSKLPENFYEHSLPSAAKDPSLLAFNSELAKELGIGFEDISNERLAEIFSGKEILEGAQPIAMAYCGHQFGHFNPSLGDGRAHLLGEVISSRGERFDIQLKGSGKSKYSRRGDGLSWIGPVIREYILSEAMHALGIPTTRALAAVKSGDCVFRDEELPGGIFTRVASSHLRVGSFEFAATRGSASDVKTLADYAINRHHPDLNEEEDKYFKFFVRVAKLKLKLVARWMGVGFIHGVMNTDNTSIAGITLDYGPCAFMDTYDPKKVFSSIDSHGRYAFSNQGQIALWNLSVLANSLYELMGKGIEELRSLFGDLESFYQEEYLKVMAAKFGIFEPVPEDMELISKFLDALYKNRLDYTLSFHNLLSLNFDKFEQGLDSSLYSQWQARLDQEGRGEKEALALCRKSNPFFIPRNHQVQKAIDESLKGNYEHFHFLIEAYKTPYDHDHNMEEYKENLALFNLSLPPKENEIVHQTFCGT